MRLKMFRSVADRWLGVVAVVAVCGVADISARADQQRESSTSPNWAAVEVRILETDTQPTRASIGNRLSFVAQAIDSQVLIAGVIMNAGAEGDAIAELQRARDGHTTVTIAGVRRTGCNLSDDRRKWLAQYPACIEVNPVVEIGSHDLRRTFRPILGLLETDSADQFRRSRLTKTSVNDAPAWPHDVMAAVIEFGVARQAAAHTTTVRAKAYHPGDGSLLGDADVLFVDGTEPLRRLAQLSGCGRLHILGIPLGAPSRGVLPVAALAVFPDELPRASQCATPPDSKPEAASAANILHDSDLAPHRH
jgi:hypothetical protein